MKIFNSLICLFLCSQMMISIDEIEQQVSEIEEYCKVVSVEEVSDTSKEIVTLSNKIEEEQSKYQSELKVEQKSLNHLKDKLEIMEEKNSDLAKYIEINMVEYQINGVDQEMIQQVESNSSKEKNLRNKIKKKKQKITNKKLKIKRCEDWIFRLSTCQSYLEEKFRDEFQTIQEGGKYDASRSINGTESLPVYGSYKSEELDSVEACLVDGDYSIDSYSASWTTMVENGTISAGTWNYPRRKYASWLRCSGFYV